jgi:hypothetical protein
MSSSSIGDNPQNINPPVWWYFKGRLFADAGIQKDAVFPRICLLIVPPPPPPPPPPPYSVIRLSSYSYCRLRNEI